MINTYIRTENKLPLDTYKKTYTKQYVQHYIYHRKRYVYEMVQNYFNKKLSYYMYKQNKSIKKKKRIICTKFDLLRVIRSEIFPFRWIARNAIESNHWIMYNHTYYDSNRNSSYWFGNFHQNMWYKIS